MRKSGVLLHLSSLPSPYGMGSFGEAAYRFVDFLDRANQSYWQILPLGPTSYGDSPYQTFSAFANNPYFIDLDRLIHESLLTHEDIIATVLDPRYVDYGALYHERLQTLKKAFWRFNQQDPHFLRFVEEEAFWLLDYAFFMALKNHFNGAPWSSWPNDIKMREEHAILRYQTMLNEDIMFQKVIQYWAFDQWACLKAYANQKGISIIGDMPIYVAYDSADVWANPTFFDLDANRMPNHVAGVPPDNFSADGQLWGNPLYNWPYLKKNGYSWWIDRVKSAMRIFDQIRIDHFIGFENFYQVPFGDTTAVNGVWKKGPGYALFKAIKSALGDVKIIAEDLGVVTEGVKKLLRRTGFPGMKLTQFGFYSASDNDFLIHHYEKNMVVYTGTHDNETSHQWFASLSEQERHRCLNYLNHGSGNPVDSLIKATLGSVADTVIIPMQDYLGLGKEARMNFPSTTGNNWKWRMLDHETNEDVCSKIRYFSELYGRNIHHK